MRSKEEIRKMIKHLESQTGTDVDRNDPCAFDRIDAQITILKWVLGKEKIEPELSENETLRLDQKA